MGIELTILPHQEDFLKAIVKAFDGIRIFDSKDPYSNPLIDLADEKIRENIENLWQGYENLQAIPSK